MLFDNADLPFLEVPNELDVGKDAYIDLSEHGVFVGDLVALQIKSGKSYRRGRDSRFLAMPTIARSGAARPCLSMDWFTIRPRALFTGWT